MTREFVYELIGYVGSALVITALLMTSLRRLRMVSFTGAVVFTIYASLIGAVPLIVVNVSIMIINGFSLYRMSRVTEYFDHMTTAPGSAYLARFLDRYHADIAQFFPDFVMPTENFQAIFVLRDLVPAGLWVARQQDESTWVVDLDYALPRFRDSKIGNYLHVPGGPLPAGRMLVAPPVEGHIRYLERMGYVEREDGWYELVQR